jgi:hypothetical protein
MNNEQNKINARRIVDEGWNKHNSKVLDELFTNDAVLHNPQDPTAAKGPQGAKTSVDTFLTATTLSSTSARSAPTPAS